MLLLQKECYLCSKSNLNSSQFPPSVLDKQNSIYTAVILWIIGHLSILPWRNHTNRIISMILHHNKNFIPYKKEAYRNYKQGTKIFTPYYFPSWCDQTKFTDIHLIWKEKKEISWPIRNRIDWITLSTVKRLSVRATLYLNNGSLGYDTKRSIHRTIRIFLHSDDLKIECAFKFRMCYMCFCKPKPWWPDEPLVLRRFSCKSCPDKCSFCDHPLPLLCCKNDMD